MEQSPSAEADSHSTGKEFTHLLWNLKVFITVFTKGHN